MKDDPTSTDRSPLTVALLLVLTATSTFALSALVLAARIDDTYGARRDQLVRGVVSSLVAAVCIGALVRSGGPVHRTLPIHRRDRADQLLLASLLAAVGLGRLTWALLSWPADVPSGTLDPEINVNRLALALTAVAALTLIGLWLHGRVTSTPSWHAVSNAAAAQPSTPVAHRALSTRLEELDRAREAGLISEDEYEDRRAHVLDDL